jgi:hypothetical protein
MAVGPLKAHLLSTLCALMVVALAGCEGDTPDLSRAASSVPAFTVLPSPLAESLLNDLGVVDADGDGRLDLYSANHNHRATLLLARGRGEFEDVSDSWHLGINPAYPGLEASERVAPAPNPGVHVYFEGNALFVRTRGLAPNAPIVGRIELTRAQTLQSKGEIETHTRSPERGREDRVHVIEFKARGSGVLEIPHRVAGHRVNFTFDPATPLDKLFIGRRAIEARATSFSLFQADRHAMSWADFNGDGLTDVFVGLGGALGLIPRSLNDELLVKQGEHFVNVATEVGIRKRRGRARRAEWVDYDGNGLLDLYVGNFESPNRLHSQLKPGQFTEVAGSLGLDLESADVFRWLDLDQDGDADLLAAVPGNPLLLFHNENGKFERHALASYPTRKPQFLSVADYDADGDLDVFVADSGASQLLTRTGSTFRAVRPRNVGLPKACLTANWLDYDNDGRADLYVGTGLYRQLESGKFELQGARKTGGLYSVRCAWFDYDDDGDRDGLCADLLGLRGSLHSLLRNDVPGGHWLQIDLVGPAHNRESIGARVVATMGDRSEVHVVGESEGAHFSQGHYRLYLGLGERRRVDSLVAIWPDGGRRHLRQVKADRRIRIARDSRAKDMGCARRSRPPP